jgi:hypothetical protein
LDVASAVAGNGTYSFAVSGGSSNVVDYSSSEGANPPQLVVVVGSGSLAIASPDLASSRLEAVVAPKEMALHANYPNPFNPATTIQYALPQAMRVRLVIYDVSGRLVRKLVDGVEDAGDRRVSWDGRDERGSAVGSGVYVYRLEAGGTTLARKMSLLK